MKHEIDRTVNTIANDIEKIFEDVNNETFTGETIKALNRFFENTLELNMEEHAVQSKAGIIGLSECGVDFRRHDSDDDYHFCVEHQSITKHSSEVIEIA